MGFSKETPLRKKVLDNSWLQFSEYESFFFVEKCDIKWRKLELLFLSFRQVS